MQPRGHTQKLKPLRHTIYMCVRIRTHTVRLPVGSPPLRYCVCASAHSPRFMFFPVLENPMIEAPGCHAAFVLRTGSSKVKSNRDALDG